MSEEKGSLNYRLIRKLFSYVSPYRTVFIISFLTMILLAVLGPIKPFMILEMIGAYVSDTGQLSENGQYIQNFVNLFGPANTVEGQIWAWTVLLIVLLLLETVIQFVSSYFSSLLGQLIIRDIRINLYRHITSFRLKYFDTTPNGVVVTRMVSDIEAIAEVFSTGFITMLGELLKILLVVVAMFIVNWEFALMALIPIPLLVIGTRIFARATKNAFQKERLQVSRLNTFVQEHISGMSIVQLFNRQKAESEKFNEINAEHRQAHFDSVWAYSVFFPVVELLSSLSIALLIMWGLIGLDVIHGDDASRTVAEILAFILWIHMLYRPIRILADKFNIFQRGIVRAERVFALLDAEHHVDDAGTRSDVEFNAPITFEKVWFAYKEKEWVLKGIDFTVPAGSSVAIVGTTGAGKSTMINLLTRFYEIGDGDIRIGEVSIKDIRLSVLRKNVAVVLQDVFLFSDTILNNITLGNPSISRDQVISAAKRVGAHDFIVKLPGEYDFNVRERGGILSVGQRQLISFIRAYVYDPKILILDEATASVDTESEELIQNATRELQKGRTSIVIAHRLSTIVNSDKILVIDAGQIIESGSHQQLIALDGKYKKLYELNFT